MTGKVEELENRVKAIEEYLEARREFKEREPEPIEPIGPPKFVDCVKVITDNEFCRKTVFYTGVGVKLRNEQNERTDYFTLTEKEFAEAVKFVLDKSEYVRNEIRRYLLEY